MGSSEEYRRIGIAASPQMERSQWNESASRTNERKIIENFKGLKIRQEHLGRTPAVLLSLSGGMVAVEIDRRV